MPLLVAATAAFSAARADDSPQNKLDAVRKALDQGRQQQEFLNRQASSLAAEVAQLRSEEVAAAQAAQAHEEALTRLEGQLEALATEQKTKLDDLNRQRLAQARLLTALLRLARNPPSGVALAQGAPVDALRGGILLSAAVPPLVERANLLRIDLNTLADLRSQIEEAESRHRIESDGLVKQQQRLRDLIAGRETLQAAAEQDAASNAQQVLKLSAEATDLKDLIDRAEAEARRREAEAAKQAQAAREAAAAQIASAAPPPVVLRGEGSQGPEVRAAIPAPEAADPTRPGTIRPFSEARGKIVYPATGKIVIGFGSTEPAGGTSKGMTLETRSGAQVIAPFDGRVVFAGPFKGYGQILIIGHGDGYHSLVAGLDHIDSSVGQWLVAGEPIGTMPAGEAKPHLYLELRHDGQPINPLPWLATRNAKVKG